LSELTLLSLQTEHGIAFEIQEELFCYSIKQNLIADEIIGKSMEFYSKINDEEKLSLLKV